MNDRHVDFYHSPQSRSVGVLALLEDLGADYTLHPLDLARGEQREAAYLAVNPMGKVPVIVHAGALVTEQGAVYQYLADLYPEATLAPPLGDARRGPYLRWLYFYGSSFEPALMDKAMKRDPGKPSTVPYGDYDTTVKTLFGQLGRAPFLTGDAFTAADMLWGMALRWTTGFGLVEATPVVTAYIERVATRPSVARAGEIDARILAERERSKPAG